MDQARNFVVSFAVQTESVVSMPGVMSGCEHSQTGDRLYGYWQARLGVDRVESSYGLKISMSSDRTGAAARGRRSSGEFSAQR